MDYKFVLTTCPYCGVGCQLFLQVMNGKIVSVQPCMDGPTNEGRLCVKGWAVHEFVTHEDRLLKPLIRENGSFTETSWEDAISRAAAELRRLRETYGPDSVAFVNSARTTNEEIYLLQKFARVYYGRNHVDHCARL
jgi:predicted molibdopterin-dependent oxidoreductase YjgC